MAKEVCTSDGFKDIYNNEVPSKFMVYSQVEGVGLGPSGSYMSAICCQKKGTFHFFLVVTCCGRQYSDLTRVDLVAWARSAVIEKKNSIIMT